MRISSRFYILVLLMAFAVSAQSHVPNKRFSKKSVNSSSCPICSSISSHSISKAESFWSDIALQIHKEFLISLVSDEEYSNISVSLSPSDPIGSGTIRAPPLS